MSITLTRTTRLTGTRAVLALALFAAAGVAWRMARTASFDTAGRAAVQSYLVTEAQRAVLDSARSTLAEVADGDLSAGIAAGEALLRAQQLSVRTLGVHGFGDTLHVRVTFAVRGEEHAHVRYLRLAHSIVSGWQVVGPSSAFAYYTRL